MKIKNSNLVKYFTDDEKGNIYILKRNGAYCLSKHLPIASQEDMLFLNNECWFNSIKEIKSQLETNYKLEY